MCKTCQSINTLFRVYDRGHQQILKNLKNMGNVINPKFLKDSNCLAQIISFATIKPISNMEIFNDISHNFITLPYC